MKRVLICAAATAVWTVFLLQPAEAAQEPCNPEPPVYHPWPPSMGPAPDLGLTPIAVICDLYKDLAGDVIWVHEGTAVVSFKPASYFEVILPVHDGSTSLTNVTGLASSPGVGVGSSEAFYAANGSGLSLWSHEEEPTDPGAFTATSVESSLWIDATHLHAANLDGGQGRDDVFGINANKDKVLIVRHNGSGFGSTQQLSSPLGDILDVTAIDWLHNGVQHLAVNYEGGLGIINPTTPPSLVQVFPFASDMGVITTLTMPNGYEAVAWARTDPSTSRAALMLKGSGGLTAGPIELDLKDCPSGTINVQPFAMEAIDYDLEPGDDLLLALPDERIAVLRNQGSPAYFLTTDVKYDVALVGELYGFPGVGQLDDGPEDVAAPGVNGNLAIFTKLPYVYVLEDAPTSAEILLMESEWGLPSPGSADRQLNMAFTVPQQYASYATHIQVILWHLTDPSVEQISGQNGAVHNLVYPLLDPETDPDQWIPLVDMVSGTCWPDDQHHYFPEFRFVYYNNGNGSITQASRFFSAGFTLRQQCGVEAVFAPYPATNADDAFLRELILEQTSEYDYGDGLEIHSSSALSIPGGGEDGAVHGLFHPSAKPPLNPGNLPPPGTIAVSTISAESIL